MGEVKSIFVQKTLSICPVCREIIEAALVVKNNDVYMDKICKYHGAFNYLYWKDYNLFKDINRIIDTHQICSYPVCIQGQSCFRHLKKTLDIVIDITNRCNYDCRVCYSDANILSVPEASAKEIYNRLPEIRGVKYTVVLIGGEPSLRSDIPEIIATVVQKGYVPRLATNGYKLLNENYVLKLKKAGLNQILLQFDGFSDSIYQKLRGGKLSNFKKKVISNLIKYNFKVQLVVMVVKGINDHEVGKIIDYAIKEKSIPWVSFYPFTLINKNLLDINEATHLSEVIGSIEEGTKGKITKKDFLDTMRLWAFLYKLTGKLQFKQELSLFSMILIVDKDNYYPINKFLNPIFAFKKIRLSIKIILSLRRLINLDRDNIPSFILFLIIQKFNDLATVNLYDTSNCHDVFMTENGFIPFDNFNILREKILKRF